QPYGILYKHAGVERRQVAMEYPCRQSVNRHVNKLRAERVECGLGVWTSETRPLDEIARRGRAEGAEETASQFGPRVDRPNLRLLGQPPIGPNEDDVGTLRRPVTDESV